MPKSLYFTPQSRHFYSAESPLPLRRVAAPPAAVSAPFPLKNLQE